MKLCPKCGTQYPDDANFCHLDAARLRAAEMALSPNGDSAGAGAAGREQSDPNLLGDRFVLGERRGGRQTGDVYDAVDRSTKASCVVKIVYEEVFPKSLLMQRTERELGKLTRLANPGIARILGYGHRDGRLWIATEYVSDYRSLLDIVFDEGPMPSIRAAEIVVAVGKALSEAAKVGVIHRDLAPKNVLVHGDSSVKLINFGVAVPTTDKVHGVAEFVAPEIVEGRPVDQRANIYSLGALFYYLVTGRPPYMGDPEDVYEQHLTGEPEPPSIHADGISDATDVVILRALARSSSKRFMTLRQLLNDVERIASGEEPLAASPAMAALAPRGKRKSRRLSQTMVGGHHVAAEAKGEQQDADGESGESGKGTELAASGSPSASAGDAAVHDGGVVSDVSAVTASSSAIDDAATSQPHRSVVVSDTVTSDAASAESSQPDATDNAITTTANMSEPVGVDRQARESGAGSSRVGLTIKEHYQDDRSAERRGQSMATRDGQASTVRSGLPPSHDERADDMDSDDIVREINQGRGLIVAIVITILLLLAAVVAVFFLSDS